eukprot:scaffold544_cov320-Pavlova_lutheri.AAC.83
MPHSLNLSFTQCSPNDIPCPFPPLHLSSLGCGRATPAWFPALFPVPSWGPHRGPPRPHERSPDSSPMGKGSSWVNPSLLKGRFLRGSGIRNPN